MGVHILRGMSETTPTCARHPGVETRLRCSACDTLICPDCWRDAAVGYHCPDCSAERNQRAAQASERISGRRSLWAGTQSASSGTSERLPISLAARSISVGLAASVVGGLLLGPVLVAGAFFLLSAGVIGWLVARSVFWAADERSTAFVRAVAITLAGFTVAIGFATSGATTAPAGIAFLAYPAALWGGWIVVRQR